MRNILSVAAMLGAVLVVGTQPVRAEASCSGNACAVLASAGDGCVWLNKGDKAIRFSLIAGGETRVVTVLAPGEAFKEPDPKVCLKEAGDGSRVEATYAVLAKMPDEDAAVVKVATKPLPRAKPVVQSTVVESVPAAASAPQAAVVAAVATTTPLPRAKPAVPVGPPLPRAKPEMAPVVAEAPIATTPIAAVQPSSAVEPVAPAEGVAACGAACPPMLFKVIDDCLWVLNLNPRAVVFEADIGGKRATLSLEAADGAKADAHLAAIAKGTAGKDEAALHMRLADPFQSSGSGIPVFRARLGSATACVKSRGEITRFNAAYVK